MQKITPFLWFDDQAEEAMNFYVGIFEDSKVLEVTRYGDAGPGPKGQVMTASFRLRGQEFVALNGGPEFTFTPAISFVVTCETQKEIDHYWEKLGKGGAYQPCGWLVDKFGVSWQVVPAGLSKLLGGKDPVKAKRATEAMLQMKKLDLAALQKAYDGK